MSKKTVIRAKAKVKKATMKLAALQRAMRRQQRVLTNATRRYNKARKSA